MGAPITIEIPHKLGKAEARSRIADGFGQMAQQMSAMGVQNLNHGWAEDALSFSGAVMGQAVCGRIEVKEASVRIEAMLPDLLGAAAALFKGKLQRQGTLLLEKK
ncbi:MAG: polyhydroxyalkanoic acid system family protein [Hyphomonadaceae bacterium]